MNNIRVYHNKIYLVVKEKVKQEKKRKEKESSLFKAIHKGNINGVKKLLDEGVNFNAKYESGRRRDKEIQH